ncbi:hypothetical protein Dip518_001246 [Parelusimicrobium proximum]|uniref:PIN domain-containing protein n=1 Tax=Parelusimicrobium proximum TaxID=3228953 RepID=UPI003D16FC13
MTEKFIISFDTNILRHSYKREPVFTKFKFGKKFDEVIALAIEKDILEKIKILIPEIVLMELIEQKILAFERYKKSFLDAVNGAEFINSEHQKGFKDDFLKFDFKKFITEEVDKYLKENNIEIIKIKEENISKIFNRLIKKSLRGDPPFSYNPEDENSKKDFGFKDAVAFETLKEYCSETNAHFSYSGIYFFSSDKIFKAAELGKEIVRFKHGLNIQQEGNTFIRDIMIKDVISKKLKEIAATNEFVNAATEEIDSNMSAYNNIDIFAYTYFNSYELITCQDENNFTAKIESIFYQEECRDDEGDVQNVCVTVSTEIKCVDGKVSIEKPVFDGDDIERIHSRDIYEEYEEYYYRTGALQPWS